MQKFTSIFCFLCLFSVAACAQSNMRTASSLPKGLNERSVKPSNKPLSVKPTASQPKEEVVEEIITVRTPRRFSPYQTSSAKKEATNSTTTPKNNAANTSSINISKQVVMPEE